MNKYDMQLAPVDDPSEQMVFAAGCDPENPDDRANDFRLRFLEWMRLEPLSAEATLTCLRD